MIISDVRYPNLGKVGTIVAVLIVLAALTGASWRITVLGGGIVLLAAIIVNKHSKWRQHSNKLLKLNPNSEASLEKNIKQLEKLIKKEEKKEDIKLFKLYQILKNLIFKEKN